MSAPSAHWAEGVIATLQQRLGAGIRRSAAARSGGRPGRGDARLHRRRADAHRGRRVRAVQRALAGGGDAGRRLLPAARLAARRRPHRRLAAAPLRRGDPRAGARGRSHPLRLAARAGAVLPDAGAVLCRGAVAGRARSRSDRRHLGGRAVVHPLCRHHHRRRELASGWRWRSSPTGMAWPWSRACS